MCLNHLTDEYCPLYVEVINHNDKKVLQISISDGYGNPIPIKNWDELNAIVSELRTYATEAFGTDHSNNDE